MGFEIGLSYGMELVALVGYPLEYSINMLFGLVLGTYFGTREGSLVVFTLGILGGLIIGTVEVYLVGLSLILHLDTYLNLQIMEL